MVILGVILAIVGAIFEIQILLTLGVILLIVGAALYLIGAFGRPIGPRRHYW